MQEGIRRLKERTQSPKTVSQRPHEELQRSQERYPRPLARSQQPRELKMELEQRRVGWLLPALSQPNLTSQVWFRQSLSHFKGIVQQELTGGKRVVLYLSIGSLSCLAKACFFIFLLKEPSFVNSIKFGFRWPRPKICAVCT